MKTQRSVVERVAAVCMKDVRPALSTGVESASVAVGGQLLHLNIIWRPQRPFGGDRPFFECPQCSRWASVLYRRPHLACRPCHRLAYEVENKTPVWRRHHRLQRLQRKAGADTSRLPCKLPPRPKWRRRRTWERLKEQIAEADADFAKAFATARMLR
jgi:hypothetical protein